MRRSRLSFCTAISLRTGSAVASSSISRDSRQRDGCSHQQDDDSDKTNADIHYVL